MAEGIHLIPFRPVRTFAECSTHSEHIHRDPAIGDDGGEWRGS